MADQITIKQRHRVLGPFNELIGLSNDVSNIVFKVRPGTMSLYNELEWMIIKVENNDGS